MTDPATTVDLMPLWNALIPLAAAVITGFGSWALVQLGRMVRNQGNTALAQFEQAQLDKLHDAMPRAVAQAEAGLRSALGSAHPALSMPSGIAADAAGYLIRQFPDAVKALGTPEQVQGFVAAWLAERDKRQPPQLAGPMTPPGSPAGIGAAFQGPPPAGDMRNAAAQSAPPA